MTALAQKDLMRITGYKRRSALIKHLEEIRVPYFTGRDGLIYAFEQSFVKAADKNITPPNDIEFQ